MESLLFHALKSSEEVHMVKKQNFSGYENKPWLGEYGQIITGINVKEAVIFPQRKVALSASILVILLLQD